MLAHSTSKSFSKVNKQTFPLVGGNIRGKENYFRQDLSLPTFIHQDSLPSFVLIPTASSLDAHFELFLKCGEIARYALILGSVIARLQLLGNVQTLKKLKTAMQLDPNREWKSVSFVARTHY